MGYQTRPYPLTVRRYLKKLLPLSLYLKYFGRHEMMSLKIWRSIARNANGSNAILDVGAYHGEFSLAARAVNSEVQIFAFEPNPDALVTLQPVADQNGFHIVSKAVSVVSGKSNFLRDGQRSSLSSGDVAGGVSVETISIDDWIQETHIRPYLIKIDVENCAAEVICGAETTMSRDQPIILCEVLSEDVGKAIDERLPDAYHRFLINENRGLESKDEISRYDWRYKNWLFLPSGIKDRIPREFFVGL
jgi:FkbM family methyltransferase